MQRLTSQGISLKGIFLETLKDKKEFLHSLNTLKMEKDSGLISKQHLFCLTKERFLTKGNSCSNARNLNHVLASSIKQDE